MMKIFKIALVLAILLLSACKETPLYSIDGTATDNPSSVVRVREGSMLLRGLDGKSWDASKIPNMFSDFLYVMKPGTHILWGMNIQGGHPLLLENLRCYAINDVELKAGVVYRLNEDKEAVRVILVREDTGAEVASGKLVDQKAAYSEGCNWK